MIIKEIADIYADSNVCTFRFLKKYLQFLCAYYLHHLQINKDPIHNQSII